jgi:tetraacyldisaccharide 4'-kinase
MGDVDTSLKTRWWSYLWIYLLNGVSLLFKTLSLVNLKLKSLRRKEYPEALIVSIDNLSFGGTGKTPLVLEIGRNLERKKVKFAVVTRGYKSKYEGRGIKVQPGHRFDEVGDEAVLFKKNFPHRDIYVGKNRRRSIESAVRDGNRIILLDDGFQSTHIHRDIKIMLFNPRHPYYYLRNFKFLMKKEDYIFYYSRQPAPGREQPAPGAHTYHFETRRFRDIRGNTVNIGNASLLGFSALGDNERLKNDLSAFNLVQFKPFMDHHVYTEKEITDLDRDRRDKEIDYLVCTEKDFVKLTRINLTDIPLIYVQNSIKLSFNVTSRLLDYAEEENYI